MPRTRLAAARSTAVIATLAVVAVGGTSYAAGKVGTQQLKQGAVTGAKVRNDSLTGADVKEGSLKQVPNARSVGGVRIKRVDINRAPGQSAGVYSSGTLDIRMTCVDEGSFSEVELTATTGVNKASIFAVVVKDSGPEDPLQDDFEDLEFTPSEGAFDLLVGDDGDVAQVDFTYHRPASGVLVQGTLLSDALNSGPFNCRVTGFITAAGPA